MKRITPPREHRESPDAALERAEKADLVTLPKDITGTNCANCKFVSGDYCKHPKVAQKLTDGPEHMCCVFWDRPGTKRAWER